jgi:putative Ca2+/H+ antiporter (TMEM165/GDT1 family)
MEYKAFFIIFISVLIAEMGDKTQLATFGFAANSDSSKWMVFAASALALTVSSAIAVLFGDMITNYVGEKTLSLASGLLFIVIGVWTLWGLR